MTDKPVEILIRESLGEGGGWDPEQLGTIEANDEIVKLRNKLETDPVTGLKNEHALGDMLLGLENAWRSDKKLNGFFVVADLDNLHGVNRDYGEKDGGDGYLEDVAEVFIQASKMNRGRCFRNGTKSDMLVLYLSGQRNQAEIKGILDEMDHKLEELCDARQIKWPGIKYGLSYCISRITEGRGPMTTFEAAANQMGAAKRPNPKDGRKGNVGRIFVRNE
jgi:GGDEF domain-containing protein